MTIGIPREVRVQEQRVALTPAAASRLARAGHRVLVCAQVGAGAGISDDHFRKMGAEICSDWERVYSESDVLVKVAAPSSAELEHLREGQVIMGFLHLAARPSLARELADRGVIAIAYETVEDMHGRLPLLYPMSEIAGKMSVQVGAHYLTTEQGGKGILLGGVPGVRSGRVVIVGGGTVGINAAKAAVGLGARVYVLDHDIRRLVYLDDIFKGRVNTIYSDNAALDELLPGTDLLVGAVLVTGKRTPVVVSEAQIKMMAPGSVVVDVSIDQGGCVETSRPTTHGSPTFEVHDVIHYCVPNMPAGVARTSSFALSNSLVGFVELLASLGIKQALSTSKALASGTNVYRGRFTHPGVAESLGEEYVPLEELVS